MVDDFITNWTKGLNRMLQENPSFFEEYSCWKKLYQKLMREKNRDKIVLLSDLCFEFLKIPIPKRRTIVTGWLDPVDIAIMCGNLEGVESFLPHGHMYKNFKAGQYFVLACRHKRGQIARWLMHELHKVPIWNIFFADDQNGRTGLYWLCHNGMAGDVEFCLSNSMARYGSHLPLEYPNGEFTPLMIATIKEHTSTVEVLFRNGAYLNATDKSGKTAFMWACWKDSTEMVQLYLNWAKEKRIDLNSADKNGRTAYIWACMFKLEQIVALIQSRAKDLGINLQSSDNDGWNGEDYLSVRRSKSEFEINQDYPLDVQLQMWNVFSNFEKF